MNKKNIESIQYIGDALFSFLVGILDMLIDDWNMRIFCVCKL